MCIILFRHNTKTHAFISGKDVRSVQSVSDSVCDAVCRVYSAHAILSVVSAYALPADRPQNICGWSGLAHWVSSPTVHAPENFVKFGVVGEIVDIYQ